jgi:hypothetical protein
MSKHKISKSLAAIEALQALESKANRVQSPPSRYLNGRWTNVCPVCLQPCSDFPWARPSCGWTAASNPGACPCQRIRYIVQAGTDYVYDVTADYSTSQHLTGAERAAWAQARAKAVDELPKGPPAWAPANGVDK